MTSVGLLARVLCLTLALSLLYACDAQDGGDASTATASEGSKAISEGDIVEALTLIARPSNTMELEIGMDRIDQWSDPSYQVDVIGLGAKYLPRLLEGEQATEDEQAIARGVAYLCGLRPDGQAVLKRYAVKDDVDDVILYPYAKSCGITAYYSIKEGIGFDPIVSIDQLRELLIASGHLPGH